MHIYNSNDKLCEVLSKNAELLPVINRFGIKLGLQNKSIGAICDEHKVDTDFFLSIINTFINEGYFPESSLRSFSPLLIIEYLKKTHDYYREYILPKTKAMLENLLLSCNKDCKELKIINIFYKKYEDELLHHLSNEEENVFPYIRNLLSNPDKTPSGYSINDFEKEHTNVDVKINDLKQLIIKYINADYDINKCNDFLNELFRFEKDLLDHARIEDNILVPMILEIEKENGRAKL